MVKNILKLEGAQKLTKVEQKEINGGMRPVACDVNGTYTGNANTCLCKSGLYSIQTQSCVNGLSANTGLYYEIATGCCYSL
jgi:hypothetical protein